MFDELILYEVGDTNKMPAGYYRGREWLEEIDKLLLDVISPYNTTRRDEHLDFIFNSYQCNIKRTKKFKYIVDEVKDDVFYHNWEIFVEAATIDYYENYYESCLDSYKKDYEDEGEINELIDEDIMSLAENYLYEFLGNDFSETISLYVIELLNELKIYHEFDTDNSVYCDIDDRVFRVTRNDCQIVMFEDIHAQQIVDKLVLPQSDYVDIKNIRIMYAG